MKTKKCNLCGSTYDARIEFCFRDGLSLTISELEQEKSTNELKIDASGIGELEDNIDFGSIGDLLDVQGSSLKSNQPIQVLELDENSDDENGFFNVDEIDYFDDDVQDTVSTQAEDNKKKESLEQIASPLFVEQVSFDEESEEDFVEEYIEAADTLDLEPFVNTIDFVDEDYKDDNTDCPTDSKIEATNYAELTTDYDYSSNVVGISNSKKIFFSTMALGVIVVLAASSSFGPNQTKELNDPVAKTEVVVNEQENGIKEFVNKKVENTTEGISLVPTEAITIVPVDPFNSPELIDEKKPEEPIEDTETQELVKVESQPEKIASKKKTKSTSKNKPVKTKPSTKVKTKPKEAVDVPSGNNANDNAVTLWGSEEITDCSLTVTSNVSNASIFVDGVKTGAINNKISIDCGKHSLRVEAKGYVSKERSIQLNSSERFVVDLDKINEE